MITVQADTIKPLILPTHCKDFSYYNYKRVDKDKRVPGLDNIKRDMYTGGALVEFNSNIFPDGPRLINRANIEDAYNILNNTGLITLAPGAVEASLGVTLDATVDAQVSNVAQALKVVKALAHDVKFSKEIYPGNDNVTFHYDLSKKGENVIRVTLYDKGTRGLRTEVRYANSAAIKKDFDVYAADNFGRAKLTDVLESRQNAPYKAFQRVAGNIFTDPNIQTHMDMLNATPRKEMIFQNTLKRKEFDLFNTLEKYDFSLNDVYLALKPREPKTKSKAKILAPYISVLQQYNLFDASLTPDFQLLLELQQYLQNPYITATLNTLPYGA